MSQRDPWDMAEDDLEKVRRGMSGDGRDWKLPAIIEGIFLSLLALCGLAWLAMLFYTPDPIPGESWLGFGLLAATLLGLPAAAIHVLRTGGEDVERKLREVTR